MLQVFHNVANILNSNKFFAGIMMLVLNIGSKYITVDFSTSQETYLRNALGREFLIFAICFVATKDVFTALVLTAVFVILGDHLFNENSQFCVMPESFKKIGSVIDTNNDGKIDDDELNAALKLLTRAKNRKKKEAQKKAYETFSLYAS